MIFNIVFPIIRHSKNFFSNYFSNIITITTLLDCCLFYL